MTWWKIIISFPICWDEAYTSNHELDNCPGVEQRMQVYPSLSENFDQYEWVKLYIQGHVMSGMFFWMLIIRQPATFRKMWRGCSDKTYWISFVRIYMYMNSYILLCQLGKGSVEMNLAWEPYFLYIHIFHNI